jgi:hypothetical protein
VGHVPKNANQHIASAPPEFSGDSQQNMTFQPNSSTHENPYLSGYLPNQPMSMPMPDFSSLSNPAADHPPSYGEIKK